MLVGLVVTLPAVALTSTPDQLDAGSVKWLTVSGIGNVAGLLIVYAALRIERVGIVAPITSTEGAVAAAIAAAAGEAIGGGTGLALGVIVVGVVLAGLVGKQNEERHDRRGALLALLGRTCPSSGPYSRRGWLVWSRSLFPLPSPPASA